MIKSAANMFFYKANINLITSFVLIQECLLLMTNNNHGHAVTFGSTVSFGTGVSNVDYACSKIGALPLYERLVQELSH